MLLVNRVQFLLTDAKQWSTGRVWIWRVGLLGYIVWSGVCHINDPNAGDLFNGITLGVHEAGHFVMGWCSETTMIMSGSIAQLIVPLGLLIYFLRQRDYFAVTVAGGWLSSSLFNIAAYIADAQMQKLPSIGIDLDATTTHDWNYLLTQWNLLDLCKPIAQGVGLVAMFVWVASIMWGTWLCWTMATTSSAPVSKPVARY